MRLVLFDCDGTLADSFEMICRTMQAAFLRREATPPPDAAVHAIIGLSLDRAIAHLAPAAAPQEVAALADAYREVFAQKRNDLAFREPLFEGIPSLLAELGRRDEVVVGMVTGKSRRGVRSILSAHGLESLFRTVRTADDCPSKPHPAMVLECCAETGIDPGETIVVGDSVYDIEMAVAAGAAALGVGWGAGSRGDLLSAGALDVAADAATLRQRLDRWFARRPLAGALA